MISDTITRHVTKLLEYPTSEKLFQPLTLPKLVDKQPDSLISLMAYRARDPLTNIILSIEMLRSEIKDDGLNIYLDISMRNSLRINDLISEFLVYQQAD
jgi:signal transduction histidine kinase